MGILHLAHLHDYAERILLNGQPIPTPTWLALVNELKPAVASSSPNLTTFEITTALAFLYFARRRWTRR